MTKHLTLFIIFAFNFSFHAQSLKLEDIMKGDEFVGHQPENPRFSFDGAKLYFDWNPNNELEASTYAWSKSNQPIKCLGQEVAESQLNFTYNKSADVVYYIKGQSIFKRSFNDKNLDKIFQFNGQISSLTLSFDEESLLFKLNENFFQFYLNQGKLLQLTNFGKKEKVSKPSDGKSFLEDQQLELFQYIKDRKAIKDYQKKNEVKTKDFPKTIDLDDFQASTFAVHPQGKFITFNQVKYPQTKRELMQQFITEDGYNKSQNIKNKVSTANFFESKFTIYNAEKDTIYQPDFSKLSNFLSLPPYLQTKKDKTQDKRFIHVNQALFNADGSLCVLDIRSQDNKDRWLVQLDLEKNTVKELDHQHDEAWIGGPGIPGYSHSRGTLGFLNDEKTLFYQSEKTGFSHLYTYDFSTQKKEALTAGDWEVREVIYATKKNKFYLTINKEHPGSHHVYTLSLTDKQLKPLHTKTGAYQLVLSPNEDDMAYLYSYKNQPWELFYFSENESEIQITQSTTEAFKQYNWREPAVITFKSQDKQNIYARLYQPEVTKKNGAAVIFVHGAGYLQNAHNYWSTYHREYMFHNLLTDLGYTVLDIDYRASDGYGRNHRTGIYRHMGGFDLSDHLDGKKYLVEQLGIDAQRVGIYGGSYGGFITLMALLNHPGEFKCGAALRSVTDWAHYNHGYTGNILNFPETDPEAYKKSSPIYFAGNLQDHLIMLHGMVDDNVEYKDVVRLSQRFIELGKKNWELATYPIEAHGFKQTYSWVDEYSRILKLFNDQLLKN
jgi:dipeptidyl aminopeptidase/acylaminoacyl peptidase